MSAGQDIYFSTIWVMVPLMGKTGLQFLQGKGFWGNQLEEKRADLQCSWDW